MRGCALPAKSSQTFNNGFNSTLARHSPLGQDGSLSVGARRINFLIPICNPFTQQALLCFRRNLDFPDIHGRNLHPQGRSGNFADGGCQILLESLTRVGRDWHHLIEIVASDHVARHRFSDTSDGITPVISIRRPDLLQNGLAIIGKLPITCDRACACINPVKHQQFDLFDNHTILAHSLLDGQFFDTGVEWHHHANTLERLKQRDSATNEARDHATLFQDSEVAGVHDEDARTAQRAESSLGTLCNLHRIVFDDPDAVVNSQEEANRAENSPPFLSLILLIHREHGARRKIAVEDKHHQDQRGGRDHPQPQRPIGARGVCSKQKGEGRPTDRHIDIWIAQV